MGWDAMGWSSTETLRQTESCDIFGSNKRKPEAEPRANRTKKASMDGCNQLMHVRCMYVAYSHALFVSFIHKYYSTSAFCIVLPTECWLHGRRADWLVRIIGVSGLNWAALGCAGLLFVAFVDSELGYMMDAIYLL